MHPQQVCRSCKTGRKAEPPDGCAFIWRDHSKLEKWPNSNWVKFSQGKCKVLHQGRNNPRHQYQLEGDFAESCFGVLVNNKLTVSQQRTLMVKKDNCTMDFIKNNISSRLREVTLSFSSALERHLWSTGSSTGVPSRKETWSYWNESIEGSQWWLSEHLSYEERLREV